MPAAAGTPLVAWGKNWYGQTNIPPAATNLVAVSAGWQHGLALRADGTLVPWGYDGDGLAVIPSEATNIVALAVGDYHSLALRADGQVFAWGKNQAGESTVPANATNIVALDGGYTHTLALRADGTVINWGDNTLGQLNIPSSATNVVAIAAGLDHNVALKADGSVVVWGFNQEGETNLPPSATNVVAISAGATHSLALRADGTLVPWGSTVFGETTIPSNVTNVAAISSGGWFNLVVLQDGTATGWGYDFNHQATPPPAVTNPAALYAGGEFSIAWLRDPSNGIAPSIWKQPQDRIIPGGDTLFLYPGINGTPPLHFQWYFTNSPLPGQTSRWLALPNANPTQTGGYLVVASNDFGAVTSVVVTVTVPAISFTTQPTNVTAMMNTSVTLAATVAGTTPLAYRWQKDGQDLSDTNRVSGSATPSLAIANVEPADTGSYQLIVTNAYTAVTSDVAILTVLFPQPLLNVDFGSSSQSSKTGFAVVGQTPSDFWSGYAAGTPGITNILFADGSPTRVGVVVSNAPSWFWNDSTDPMMHEAIIPVGDSTPFPVTIFGLPPGTYSFFLYAPGNTYLAVGSDFELIAGGISLGHRVVQWGVDAPPWQEGGNYGAFHDVTITTPGQTVTIIVSGNYYYSPAIAGLQIGQFLALTGGTPPVFWSQPASQYVPVGTNLVLNATGTGYPSPLHQWFFNGTLLTNGGRYSGADDNTLTISGVDFADAGDYVAVLTNASGVVTSDTAHVVIGNPPVLTLQPTNQTWIAGTTRSLAAQATGTDPLAYQWYLGVTPLTNNARLSGTTSNILTVSNVTSSDAGTYTLFITNLFGSVTCTATVSVVVPPAFISQPAGHSVPVGLPVTLTALVSGTAPFSYQWQFDGTSIPGATSNTLSLAALAPADFGDYQLVVTNLGGAVTSAVALLTIGPVATWGSYSPNLGSPLWPAAGLSNVIAIAGGSGYSLVLRADGTLHAWGYGPAATVPVGLDDIVGIAAGASHALAIRADGSVVAWGSNSSGQTNVPSGLSNVVAVTAGAYHSVALRADGTVVVWGGSSRTGETNVPPGLIKVVAIDACGSQTIALRENGTLVGWGGNPPIPVPAYLHGVTGVAAGGMTSDLNLALLSDGTVSAWNAYGPATNLPPGLTNIIAVDVAGNSRDQFLSPTTGVGLALRSNGNVTAWGASSTGLTNVPPGLSNVVAIAGGATHALALVNDGRPLIVRPPVGGTFYSGSELALYANAIGNAPCSFQWFKDGYSVPDATNQSLVLPAAQSTYTGSYQLVVSNALGIAQSIPVPVIVVDNAPQFLSQPASGFAYYGSPFSVGASVIGSGPLQLSWMQDNQLIATGIEELTFDRALPSHGGVYQLIASNPFGSLTTSVAHITFTRLASWGTGPSLTNAPFDLGSVLSVASGYFHALAIQSNRTVAAWGTTANGATNVPPGLSNVLAVAGGNYFSAALSGDGTVTTWGVGIPFQTNVLAGLSNVIAISAGGNHALALRADGTVTAWGQNSSGQTNVPDGLGNVVALAAGSAHSLALRGDGTVVGWGLYGKIPAYTNAVAISAGYGQCLLLQADGTVVTWSTAGKDTPLPAGMTNIVAISAGGGWQGYSHSVALRTDGTIIAWGNNLTGQLMVPQDLVSATTLSAGGGSTLALLNDRSPALTLQPWSRSIPAGADVTLRALAVSQSAVGYQWYWNGQPLPGATANWLAFTNALPTNSGAYHLVATNHYGAVTSLLATLIVTIPPPHLSPLGLSTDGFSFSFNSLPTVLYIIETKNSLADPSWSELTRQPGTGQPIVINDPRSPAPTRFYRVRAE
jgi:alpha-tubulin suppressor-like RCC1 family protein